MKCPRCARILDSENSFRFCPHCGVSLETGDSPPPLPKVPVFTNDHMPPPLPEHGIDEQNEKNPSLPRTIRGTVTWIVFFIAFIAVFDWLFSFLWTPDDSKAKKLPPLSLNHIKIEAPTALQEPSTARNANTIVKGSDSHTKPQDEPKDRQQPKEQPRPSPQSQVTQSSNLSAKDFGDLWHSNRFAFERQYSGKQVVLEGAVGRVAEEDGTMRVGLLSTEMLLGTSLVNCYLNVSESQKALQLQAQDNIVIRGTCVIQKDAFDDDELAIRNCCIVRMPQHSAPDTTIKEGETKKITLGQLRQEIDDNEPRAMQKYRGKRVIVTVTWDRVERGSDGVPELHVMDFSSLCMATCLLRRDQEDTVARIKIGSAPISVNAIFDGGDCEWTGLKFRDGFIVK